MKRARILKKLGIGIALSGLLFVGATVLSIQNPVSTFKNAFTAQESVAVRDRNGIPLSVSYQIRWNTDDKIPLYAMPGLLKDGFIFSEDKRFFFHYGVDVRAKFSAIALNIRHRDIKRGASTITEQVVRMIHPRPRTFWSKWIESLESIWLETHIQKNDIFEFYLNQIPYAGSRRGVAQGARYYFARDLSTLSHQEILALIVLARAPSAYDPYTNPQNLERPLKMLSQKMADAGLVKEYQAEHTLDLKKPNIPTEARHFARYARLKNQSNNTEIQTTLDANLQSHIQKILDTRLRNLNAKNVHNAGALVIDHQNNQILAWVIGGATDRQTKAGDIDPVITPRQPGSTLKPFLYAMALEKGWHSTRILNDAPLAESVGRGLHRFRNYSNSYYGSVTLREALGNSLNIPAILTIGYVGVPDFLEKLHALGFESLQKNADIYDEGLALGNGEVTLLELTNAYATLARAGIYKEPDFQFNAATNKKIKNVFNAESATLIGNILSDPHARALEFGSRSLLNLPIPTALKTGTSTDYRDAWTVGYNDRYTVGVWMGNLDRAPMNEVTGSTGPALVLRSIFGILNQGRDAAPLPLSPYLQQKEICLNINGNDKPCVQKIDYFLSDTKNDSDINSYKKTTPELVRPTDGLMVAYDPRIPTAHQKFRFEIANKPENVHILWVLNGQELDSTPQNSYLWHVRKGKFFLDATLINQDGTRQTLPRAHFIVK